jgi:hypothetical protein
VDAIQVVDSLVDTGFGESDGADLDALRKALSIGTTDPPVGADALRVESLDATLKVLTYLMANLKLWQAIPKSGASSTIEEYNQLVAYGSDGGGFVDGGELPEEEDTTYARASQKVKYVGTTRSVTHPSTLIRTLPANIIAQETEAGALWLMKKIDQALFDGDEDAIPISWNGLTKQIVDGGSVVIDAAGAALTKNDIENAAQQSIDNFGAPSQMFANPRVFTDFSKLYYTTERWAQPGSSGGRVGTPVTGFNTLSGEIGFNADVFAKRGAAPPTAATSSKAPNAPTLAIGGPGATTGSAFVVADAGNYRWQVTAVNRYGESLPCTISASTAVVAGDGIILTITDTGGTNGATAYKLYRTQVGGTSTFYTHKIIARLKAAGVYTSPTLFTDINEFRSRMFNVLLLDTSPQVLTFRQLAPLLRMPLAMISPAIRWMQLLYGTPIVFAPKKCVLIRNVAQAA